MESDGTSTPASEAPSSTSVSGTESGGLPFEVIVGLVIGMYNLASGMLKLKLERIL